LLLILVLFMPTAHAAEVSLAWDPNTETDLSGYRLYRGAQSRVYTASVDVETVTNYVWTVPDGNWFLAATAYNAAGLESDYSDEVQWSNASAAIQPATNVHIVLHGGALLAESGVLTTEARERIGI
jgi:hypothetical protein